MCGMLFGSRRLTTIPHTHTYIAGTGGKAYGGADACPRCGTRVYAAEKIVGAGSVSTLCRLLCSNGHNFSYVGPIQIIL